MVLSPDDLELATAVNRELATGKSIEQIAEDYAITGAALRSKIDRMGYEIESVTCRRLIPKRAPDLESI